MSISLQDFYAETELCNADLWNIDSPNNATDDARLDKEKWLEIGQRINRKSNKDFCIDSIFFVKNNPISVFVKVLNPNPPKQAIFNTIWNLARPRFLFLEINGEIEVYDLGQKPHNSQQPVLDTLSNLYDCLKYHREIQESENLFLDDKLSKKNNTADKALIDDLKELRKILLGKSKEIVLGEENILIKHQVHALIGQTIFVRYLEDRHILDKEYFERIAQQNENNKKEWLAILHKETDKNNLLNPEIADKYFPKILTNRDFTIAFFQQLITDFNGDLFLKNENYQFLKQAHLNIIHDFLLADLGKQKKIWLWAYQFDIIPLEFISNIYEEFYHNTTKDDEKGTHYTPTSLVDFLLSQTLTTENLAKNPRILDPSCGSGIFLVESFRRIVRYKKLFEGFKPDFEALNLILKQQIRGIELNPDAAKITAFSLYIALLDFLDPPYIRYYIQHGQQLPFLLYTQEGNGNHLNIILDTNAFWVEDLFSGDSGDKGLSDFQPNTVDIVLGNPPWGSADLKGESKEAEKVAIQWCKNGSFPISDNERSQMFIWRSLALLKPNGIAALLVSSGVLFKSSDASNQFKYAWTSQSTLLQIFNFVHTRHIFFSSAISPFLGVIFQKKQPERNHKIHYWTFRNTQRIAKTQAAILDKTDFKFIPQYLADVPDIWKIHYFGNHKDYSLITNLRLYPTLEELEKKQGKGKNTRQGLIIGKDANEKKEYSWLKDYRFAEKEQFISRYGKLMVEQFSYTPTGLTRGRTPYIYEGKRLLINAGIKQNNNLSVKGYLVIRYEDETFSFSSSVTCIKIQDETESNYKMILGILWSNLTRYYLFLTASKWPIWHSNILVHEVIKIPIVEIDQDNEIYKNKIITIVDKLRNGEYQDNKNLLNENHYTESIKELEKQLDQAVFDLYYLSDAQKDLVRERCKYDIDFYYNNTHSIAVKPLANFKSYLHGKLADIEVVDSEIESYLSTFQKAFKPYMKGNKELYYEVIRSKNVNWQHQNMIDSVAVVFSWEKNIAKEEKELKDWKSLIAKIAETQKKEISENIYIDSFLRIISSENIFIIKRNEKRLWTNSAAREDAEAVFIQFQMLNTLKINE